MDAQLVEATLKIALERCANGWIALPTLRAAETCAADKIEKSIETALDVE